MTAWKHGRLLLGYRRCILSGSANTGDCTALGALHRQGCHLPHHKPLFCRRPHQQCTTTLIYPSPMRIPPLIPIALSVAAMALLLWPAYSSSKAYAELFDILPTHTSTAPNISTSIHPVGLHSLLDLSMVQANTIRTLFVLP